MAPKLQRFHQANGEGQGWGMNALQSCEQTVGVGSPKGRTRFSADAIRGMGTFWLESRWKVPRGKIFDDLDTFSQTL